MKKLADSKFTRLIGIWKTTGHIKSDQQTQLLSGTDSYEYILDGNYILHKADVTMGNDRSETFELIRLSNEPDKATMQYFNSKGEEGSMTCSLLKNDFKIEGKGLKFSGTFNNENTLISGKWHRKSDDEEWTAFIELTLEKKNQPVNDERY